MSQKQKKPNQYVNNKQLYAAMVEYNDAVKKAAAENTRKPRVPEQVGAALLLIATRLANKPYFNGFSYKDEMISDGISNCIEYIDNFNPDKYKNPFAYFTQIIKFAFVRRIEKETKQKYIQIKNLERVQLFDPSITVSSDQQQHNDRFITTFENKLTDKKKSSTVERDINPFFRRKKPNGEQSNGH